MAPTTADKEILAIQQIAGSFLRHPQQVNRLFEADGEIIDFRNQQAEYLVFKSDGIREEIREGLYTDPYLIGWMSVTVAISDLAASGADPLGILLSLQIPPALSTDWIAG